MKRTGKILLGVLLAFVLLILLAALAGPPSTKVESGTSTPSQASAPSQAGAIIRHKAQVMPVVGPSELPTRAGPGFTYLVVDLDIENRDYDEFPVNVLFSFKAVVAGVQYGSDFASTQVAKPLQTVTLQRGGRISGQLAFKIPETSTVPTYSLIYEAPFKSFNVNFVSMQQATSDTPQQAAASVSEEAKPYVWGYACNDGLYAENASLCGRVVGYLCVDGNVVPNAKECIGRPSLGAGGPRGPSGAR